MRLGTPRQGAKWLPAVRSGGISIEVPRDGPQNVPNASKGGYSAYIVILYSISASSSTPIKAMPPRPLIRSSLFRFTCISPYVIDRIITVTVRPVIEPDILATQGTEPCPYPSTNSTYRAQVDVRYTEVAVLVPAHRALDELVHVLGLVSFEPVKYAFFDAHRSSSSSYQSRSQLGSSSHFQAFLSSRPRLRSLP